MELPGVGGRLPRPIRRQYLSGSSSRARKRSSPFCGRRSSGPATRENLGAGVVLTGGGSSWTASPTSGSGCSAPLPEGNPIGIGGLVEVVNGPAFATAVGLVQYGAEGVGEGLPVGGGPGKRRCDRPVQAVPVGFF